MPKRLASLDEFIQEDQNEPQSGIIVPNKQPSLSGFPYRIAVIGEAPGKDEESALEPFVGMSGRLLSALLGKANIVREACFVGNVCQLRPPRNDIEEFDRCGPEITNGLSVLSTDLAQFKPNLCVLLGKTALWAALGTDKISDWRGSLFIGSKAPFLGLKCLASFHPAACLRQYEWTPLLAFDLKKAATEGLTSSLVLPNRLLITNLSAFEIAERCDRIIAENTSVSVDIEGYVFAMSCISVATSADLSFIIPFAKNDGSNYWPTVDEEVLVWRALSRLLAAPNVPKILQNSLYDRFVLQYGYQCLMSNVRDDTMLKHHELYCELEKSLAFQCSLYTKEPFYKSDRKSDDQDTFYRYCCKDSAVTLEISDKLEAILRPEQKEHYQFNMSMLNCLLYMELRGIRYATDLAKKRLKEVNNLIYNLQYDLNRLSGFFLDTKQPRQVLVDRCRSIMGYKKDPSRPKKEFADDYDRVIRILVREGPLSKEEVGYIETVCDIGLNTKGEALKSYLYSTLKLPVQLHPKTKKPTTDVKAMLKLRKKSDAKELELVANIQELRTRAQMLEIKADPDGRIRCGYNVVGTKTGRLSCYTSPTGSGYNLTTIPDKNPLQPEGHPLRSGMRDLILADEDHWMAQLDLKGSDGWTIGAHLNALGDPTMIDDLRFGIKPAARLCYMLRHGNSSLVGKPRSEIKELLKEIKGEDWDYFACKIAIWGICYTMGPDLLADKILEESYGKVALSRADVKNFHTAVHSAYRIRLWHDATARAMARKPELRCDGGHTRRFFGRAREILGDVLSHEPQYNTTRATNMAMFRLWSDPENRRDNGSLIVEPLHSVHDALITHFRKDITTWTTKKLYEWFDNPIIVAGQRIVIPFDGKYGESWGNLTAGVI